MKPDATAAPIPVSRGDFRSLRGIATSLRSGSVRSEDLVREALERIAASSAELNAVCSVSTIALESGRSADSRRGRRAFLGALHGVPMTIKDCFEVAGLPTSCGSPALRDHRPTTTAPAVRRLIAAGAIVIGKTNVPIYTLDLETRNEPFGQTHNPWARDRSPGGSSGGAAAAVAAGLVPAELGTDLAGSLRIPAHYCGISSLKPTYGRIPLAGTISSPTQRLREPDLTVAGPLARSVDDLRLLYGILADEPLATGAIRPGNLRIAAWLDSEICPVDEGVRAVITDLCRELRAAGAHIDHQARPVFDAEKYFRHFLQMIYGEMSGSFPESVYRKFRAVARPEPESGWTPLTAMRDGMTQSHRDWLSALDDRERYRVAWATLFTDYDAVLAPVAPTSAPFPDSRPFDQREVTLGTRSFPIMQQTFWVGLATAAGLPAVTIPAGLDASGLPVGVQLIGASGDEGRLLDIAAAIESLTGGFRPPPHFS